MRKEEKIGARISRPKENTTITGDTLARDFAESEVTNVMKRANVEHSTALLNF